LGGIFCQLIVKKNTTVHIIFKLNFTRPITVRVYGGVEYTRAI
jgi:hypothetical protein